MPPIEMLQKVSHLVNSDDEAQALGFEPFNGCPHLLVNVPDGGFTISCKTADGRTATFHFGVYEKGGSPTFIDIQHQTKAVRQPGCNRDDRPAFEVTGFRPGGDVFDTRRMETTPSLICIHLEGSKHAVKVKPKD